MIFIMYWEIYMRYSMLIICSVLLSACADEIGYDAGHSDGYATGYNTACKIRATYIHGNWSNEDYSRGYSDGNVAGINACHRDE